MKTAVITGITGQDGAYLSSFLLNKNYRVIGIVRNASKSNVKNVKYLGVSDRITLVEANLLDLSNIIRILDKNKPDEFYNLAAQSSVSLSFEQPIGTLEFNIISVANTLEAIKVVNPKIKYYQASSSEMFGKVKKENLPVKEDFMFYPVSPYGISKAAAHWLVVNNREGYCLFAVCGILFNHESVLRGSSFVTKKILNTAVKIKMGLLNKLELGNVKIYRDWGYTPKYVEAMWLMLQQEFPKDYVICSGEVHSLEEFVQKVFEKLGLTLEDHVVLDKGLYRPVELEKIYGDNAEAKRMLGWNYDMSFDRLIETLIKDEIQYIEYESKLNQI